MNSLYYYIHLWYSLTLCQRLSASHKSRLRLPHAFITPDANQLSHSRDQTLQHSTSFETLPSERLTIMPLHSQPLRSTNQPKVEEKLLNSFQSKSKLWASKETIILTFRALGTCTNIISRM